MRLVHLTRLSDGQRTALKARLGGLFSLRRLSDALNFQLSDATFVLTEFQSIQIPAWA